MKKITLLLLIACSIGLQAQTREKVKGSKIVTVEQKETGEFTEIEIADNLEIFLIKGDKCSVEIEADDNLHDAISISEHGNLLQLAAVKDVTGAKKFSIRVTYTDGLRSLTARNDANVTALADITLTDFTCKVFDNAKFFANAKCKKFTFLANDKTKSELNLTAENTQIELSKNATLKALISSSALNIDLYQKSVATVEGDSNDLRLRLDNNATYTGTNLTAKNANVLAEGYSTCSILCNTWMAIEATGKADITIYGDQKIDLRRFQDNAVLHKKPTK